MRLTDLDASWDEPFRDPAFYLRFELGYGFSNVHAPVPRFIQAFDRARAIADAVFRSSVTVLAVGASSTGASVDGFADLQSIGFNIPDPSQGDMRDLIEALRGDNPFSKEDRRKLADSIENQAKLTWRAPFNPTENDPEAPELCWRAFDLKGERILRDTLIWNSIACEMPVEPKAAVHSFLVDFERGLMIDVYDDRGMDVFATDPLAVLPVYQEFNSWLLDYDRPRMDAVMKPLMTA